MKMVRDLQYGRRWKLITVVNGGGGEGAGIGEKVKKKKKMQKGKKAKRAASTRKPLFLAYLIPTFSI